MKTKEDIRDRYSLPENAKVIMYRNVSEFKYFQLEPINPTHKILLWGVLKKCNRKTKFNTRVLAGKINIPLIAFLFSSLFIDTNLTVLIIKILFSILMGYCIYILPIYGINHLKEVIKYLLAYKEV